MKRATSGKAAFVQDVISKLDAGEDPRRVMQRLNAQIVACQRAGEEVPASLLRLSQALAIECASHSQGR